MTPELYQRIQALVQSALELESGDRVSFLNEACAGDESLRRQVESLLVSHEQAGSFLESPAAEVAAPLVTDAQTRLMAGEAIGPYRILSQIGSGGMGEVYLAHDTRLGRKIALKLVSASFTKDDERVRRFRQEASAASALNHPNILTIHEVGQTDSAHFMATEFIEGETLRERLRRGPMNLDEVLDIGLQVASALAAAHGSGIAHRDIKPENIMIRRDGYVKVLDFGLAKLTERVAAGREFEKEAATLVKTNPGMVLGTVSYMSPEQARGLEVDLRTDIWSLGVVLYEMVEGRVPFAGQTMSHIIVSILDREPAPLIQHPGALGSELERVVIKALAKDREQRYQKVSEMLVDLRHMKQEMEFEAKLRRSGVEVIGRSSGQTVLGNSKPAKASSSKLAAPRSTRKRTTKAIDSLAVLPFINASADPEADYLSDGITESIIDNLAQLSGLRVMARNTVFRYKGTEANAQGVGQELNVGAVLLGRVLAFGEQLSIRAELVDAADGAQLWGAQYKRTPSDILELQEEIANEISEALQLKLSSEEKERLTKRYTDNTEAHHAYLKGRYFFYKRTPEGLRKGIEYFQQAIEIDPIYALAYSGVADCYAVLGLWEESPPKESFPKAKAAALKALEIDDTIAEAYTSLAMVRTVYNFSWAVGETEFKRAIELRPGYALAHHWYGWQLLELGRFDESVAEMQEAQELDPLSPLMNTGLGYSFHFARQHDRAIEHYRQTLEIDPNFALAHHALGLAYEQKRMYSEAILEFQKASTLFPGNTLMVASLSHAYAVAGKRGEALKLLAELQEQSKRKYVSPYGMAIGYTGLREQGQVFEWLEKAFAERAGWLVLLKVEPRFDSLRADPRFADLVQRIGLEP